MNTDELDRLEAAIEAETPALLERSRRRQAALTEQNVSGQLRRAIAASGLKYEDICRASGVTFEQLADFMTGDALPSTAIDQLAAIVKYELTPAG